jgi:hypothetical protein
VSGLEGLRGGAAGSPRPDPGFIARVFRAVNDGWSLGFLVAAAFLAAAAVVMFSLVRVDKDAAARALKERAAAA